MKQWKKRIFDIIQIGNKEDLPSRAFDIIIVIAIFLNIAVLFLETFEELQPYYMTLRVIESVTVLFFIIEYALRIWTSEYLYPDCSRGKAVRKFLISYDGIVDLGTILPFFFLGGFVAFRLLRVVRIFHLFRVNAYYDSFHVIVTVLKEKLNQIFSSLFIIIVLLLASSLCIYNAEHEAQPEVFSNALSGLWWSVSTIFTVGYGDAYPITPLGRFMAIVITFLGVGAVAIPTGIISAGFVEQYTKLQRKQPGSRNVATVVVEDESSYCGKSIGEVERLFDLEILTVMREGALVVPSDPVTLKAGDTFVFQKH
ncbi:MAG: ion transporter [Lachnospiraceae bacterium]|nr:ion transporter [Lachnospiraceae bacterium]